ncbi:hypothetical protein [Streptomyces sp. NPDC050287]|uniref:hypothetical protein n=1 Tax=Streptomyces sp. NPDC050287 TaxID=3365608 RepID=UPI00378FC744
MELLDPLPDTSGALSLLWRASSDGNNAYCLNIDPDLRVIRLVAKANGYFDDDVAALAHLPALVRRGTTYPVRILTEATASRCSSTAGGSST